MFFKDNLSMKAQPRTTDLCWCTGLGLKIVSDCANKTQRCTERALVGRWTFKHGNHNNRERVIWEKMGNTPKLVPKQFLTLNNKLISTLFTIKIIKIVKLNIFKIQVTLSGPLINIRYIGGLPSSNGLWPVSNSLRP